jgi:hypothetical protein
MLREELQLPGELLDVERHAVRQIFRRFEVGSARLDRRDERHRLAIERRMFGW